MQPREGKVCLTFKPCDSEHLVTAVAGVADGDVKKGRLADAGYTGDQQSAAVLRRRGKSFLELSQLSVPADQPGSAHPRLIVPLPHI